MKKVSTAQQNEFESLVHAIQKKGKTTEIYIALNGLIFQIFASAGVLLKCV